MDKKETSPELSPEDLKAIGEISLGPAKHEVFLNNHYKKVLCGIIIGGIGIGIGIAFVANKQNAQDLAASHIIESLSEGKNGNIKAEAAITVMKDFVETPAASTAKLITALQDLKDGKVESAITALQNIANSSNDITISSRAAASVANYYMAENETDKAIDAWKKVVSMPANPYSALAYLNLGDMAQVAGEKDLARGYYNSIKEKCETSAFINSQDVEVRLMLLDVDAPQAVTPAAPPITEEIDSGMQVPDLNTTPELNLDLDTSLDAPLAPVVPVAPAPEAPATPVETPAA